MNPNLTLSLYEITSWNGSLNNLLKVIMHCTSVRRLEIDWESEEYGPSYLLKSASQRSRNDRSLIALISL